MAKTLLLADDSVTIQKVVNISFASEDVTLVTVDNGDDAIERAKETRPDLVLADVVMPGKSGYEVCEALKADPELSHIPVLLLTGTFEAFDEERASRAGAAGHVSKPFEAQTLVARVKELLAAAPAAAPAPPEAPIEADPVAASASDDDSFDFFDDDLSEAPAVVPEAISIDDADSAFAFGDDEITPMELPAAGVATESSPPPLAEAPFADRTVAILPDDPSESQTGVEASLSTEPVEIPPTALDADLGDDAFAGLDDDLLSIPDSGADDSFVTADPTGSAEDAYDFSFDDDPVGASDPSEAASVESADVAQATLIDPKGASGYDVSSSDLGDPLDFGSLDEAVAAPEPIAAGPASGETADATQFLDLDSLVDAPAAADESFAAVEMVDEPTPSDSPQAGFAAAEISEPVVAAAPPPSEAPKALSGDSAAAADSVLAEITPQLREEIHDTLEKIAWESFGSVTEKIVAEVVERVERVAWEVVPQLTETLVKAEIRRLKGESDD